MSPKLLSLALLIVTANVSAEPWTYSGTLSDGDKPANGRYDLRVTLLDATRSNPIGSPITFYSVQVKDGAFTVDVDFGSDLSNAPAMLLKTEVSKDNAPFVALGEPSRFDPKVTLAGVCWDTQGNAGTNPVTNFIGTTDNQPLVMRANNVPVLTVIPKQYSPNLVAGAEGNSADAGYYGQTVAGGGSTLSGCVAGACFNSTRNLYATVSGGKGNAASGDSSTVLGGNNNLASGVSSIVGGGFNTASNNFSSAIGGYKNRAVGKFSTVSGGSYACAGGDTSWAGGYNAIIRAGNDPDDVPCPGYSDSGDPDGHEGTFMWAGQESVGFVSTGPNQFLVRAAGGVAINTATKPNGTSPIDAELTITSNTARPDTNVEIFMYPRLSTFGYLMGVQGTQQSNDSFFITQTDGNTFSTKLQIDGNGTTFVQGGAVGNLSDVRLKKNIGPIPRPLDQLLALQGHVYEYIDPAKAMNAPGPRMGFVAQEVQTVLPNWVKPTGNEGYLAVTPIGFEALAVEAVRDLKAENDVRMEALEKENASLRARLERLEAKVKP